MVTLNKAASDANLSGVLFDLKGFNLSLAQAQELGGMMQKLRGGGKKVFVFASDFTPATYVLATHADAVLMPEEGNVLIPGVSLGMLFFKGLLDKIGVQADMLQVGKYKGAEEPFTRTEASPEFKEQMTKIVDGLYGQVVQALSANRKLGQDKSGGRHRPGLVHRPAGERGRAGGRPAHPRRAEGLAGQAVLRRSGAAG